MGQGRVGVQAPDQFGASHARHDDVGDQQIGTLRQRDRESFFAVAGLEDLVPRIAQQGDDQQAAGRTVVDDHDARHRQAPLGRVRQASISASSRALSIGRTMKRSAPADSAARRSASRCIVDEMNTKGTRRSSAVAFTRA